MWELTNFWESVLFQVQVYRGAPFLAHQKLPIRPVHFDRWLELFRRTINTHFVGAKAAEALLRAEKIAQVFQYKLALKTS